MGTESPFSSNGASPRTSRYLVVANQTVCGEALLDAVKQRMEAGPSAFHVLIPAGPPLDTFIWDETEVTESARRRLEDVHRCFGSLGAVVLGEIGDPNPVEAVADVLREHHFDEIILSTLPPGASRWLGKDLPRRMGRRFSIPMTLVLGLPEPCVNEPASAMAAA
jgi:hypothetical protein